MKPWYHYCVEVLRLEDPVLRGELNRAFLEERGSRPQDETGCVVEFVRGSRHWCGVVRPSPSRSRRLWLLDQEGKESWVSRDKVVEVSRERLEPRPRPELIRTLRQIDTRREAVKQELDLGTLWEIATESGQETWTLEELVALYFGREIPEDGRPALARALDEGKWFGRREQGFIPRPAEVVAQRQQVAARQQEDERRLEETARWLRQVADGQIAEPPAGAAWAISRLEEVALGSIQGKEAGAELMHRAHLHGPQAAFQVLVRLGQWEEDEDLELRRHRIPVEFGPQVLAAAQQQKWRPEARTCRRWWGGRVCGVSPEGGVCEQAFSLRRTLRGYRVGLHWPAPALLVQPGDEVCEEAAIRGLALDLPDRHIPMLPPRIAELCRLVPGEVRPALSLDLRFDRRWQLRGYAFRLCRVRLRQVLSWAEVDCRAGEDRSWRCLHQLTLALQAKRLEAGGLVLPQARLDIRVRDRQISLRRREDGPARLICQELDLLAGSLAGEWCAQEEVPALYQVQDLPAVAVPRIEGDDRAQVHEQGKALPRPALQVRPGPNQALGLKYYIPLERPGVRYADLMMQQQLVHWLAHRTLLYSREELGQGLEDTAWAREVGERITAARQRYWGLKYLEEKDGREVEAVVLERLGAGCLVELCEYPLKAFLPPQREVRMAPGDRVRVRIAEVSARRGQLRLAQVQRIAV